MRYKVSFEFDTNLDVNGNPAEWYWDNLLKDVEDDNTTIHFDTLTIHYQTWEVV